MMDNNKAVQASRILLTTACVVIVIAGMKLAQGFFVPILLAAFIATVSFPITSWLRSHKVPRFFAVLLTVLVDFAFLTGIVLIVISLTGDLESKWQSKYYPATVEKIESITTSTTELLKQWGVENAEEKVELSGASRLQKTMEDYLEVGKVLDVSTDVAWRAASFMGTSLLVAIMTIFMLSEARMFGRRATAITAANGPDLERIFSATRDIQRYLAMKVVVSLATGLLAGFLCWAAGLDFFVLWGIVAFLLNFIPVLGSFIAGVPPVVLAFLVAGGPSALAVGIGYISINIFLGNFLEPMLMGRHFGLSTLVVIVSVLFWGWIWGPVGMLLAVPLTMVMKVMLDNTQELRWLSIAISKEKRQPILSPEDDDEEASRIPNTVVERS